jgi:hypothetical protein
LRFLQHIPTLRDSKKVVISFCQSRF